MSAETLDYLRALLGAAEGAGGGDSAVWTVRLLPNDYWYHNCFVAQKTMLWMVPNHRSSTSYR